MTAIYVIFFICYAIGFLLLAFVRRLQVLLPVGAGALLLLAWALSDVTGEDSPGVFIAAPMVLLVILGLGAGFIATLLVLWGRRYSQSWKVPAIVLPATFIAVPALAFALTSWQRAGAKARFAPPSPACLARPHPVILGDTPLAVPLAPGLSVGTGRDFFPNYLFEINEKARQFCAETAAGRVTITNLTVRLVPARSPTDPFCASSRPYGWWHDLCRRNYDDPPSDYPSKVTFYVLGEYDARRLHAFSADELAEFQPRGMAAVDLGDGVRRYGAERPYFTRADVPGYLARCHRTTQPHAALACVVGYRLTPRIGVIYDFTTRAADFPERSATVDRRAQEMLESLKPQGSP